MGKTRDLIKTHSTILSDIFKSFGVEGGFGEIVNHPDAKWFYNGDGINFYEKDCEYGYESCNECGTSDGLVMYYTRENGETYYSIFDKSNELTEDELHALDSY